MSIAVSGTVKPSRLLLIMTLGMCVGIVATGCAVGLGVVGYFSFLARIFILSASIICTLFALFQLHRQRKSFRIDISGIGEIRMAHDVINRQSTSEPSHDSCAEWEVVKLMEGSTLWPKLLFLCVKPESGKTRVLRILPDCVSAAEFRALSAACRWIAASKHQPKREA